MQKLKFFFILSLLIFSINLSSATVGDEISEDVVTDTSFTTTPMSYSLEDPDFDFLHDWLDLIIELDVQNLTEYEFEYSIYDNATNIYLYSGNNYFDTTYYGIQSVSVPIEGHYFYDMGIAGYIKIYVYLYETQNWTYLGQKEMVIWINSSDFELPPVIIDESTITVTYYDIETNSNQTFPSGSVDLIFVDFNYTQRISGYFEGNGHYYTNFDYIYSNNYDDWVEQPAGEYSHRLIFSSETLSNLGVFQLYFSVYGYLSYNNYNDWYYTPNYNFQRTTTGSMFEAPVFTYQYYGISFVDEDANSLVDAFDVQFQINARKDIELDMFVEMQFNDGYDWFYTHSSNFINITSDQEFVTFRLDATQLYGETPYNYFELYLSGNVYNYWDTFSLSNYTYWNNVPITHPSYDKPVVYIEQVTFTPAHNAATILDLDDANYDYLMVNITVSSKIAGSLDYYLDFYVENTGYYPLYYSGYSDVSIGNSTFTYIVDASILASIWGGNLTLYSEVDIYDPTDGNYYYYWTNSIYSFNSTDFNPTGYYNDPTTPPVDPKPEPTDPGNTDPTDTDPTTTDPIDTNVDTNTTDTLNGTESTQATPDVPVLDLPAPSLYLTFISILAILIIKKKQSTLNK